jgi:ketosteroid isomerase-like protein
MSLNNKDILLQANACVTKGDNEGFLTFCTEDTVWEFVGDQILEGKQAVRDYMNEAYTEPPNFDIEKVIEGDEHVIAIGKISMKNKTGDFINYAYCDVWQIRDGKLATLKAFIIEQKQR